MSVKIQYYKGENKIWIFKYTYYVAEIKSGLVTDEKSAKQLIKSLKWKLGKFIKTEWGFEVSVLNNK